jgi:hypothetical protein
MCGYGQISKSADVITKIHHLQSANIDTGVMLHITLLSSIICPVSYHIGRFTQLNYSTKIPI